MSSSVAASVRARLRNRARADDRPFQELLQYYGLERFLFRLSRSEFCDRFVLKGALLLRIWDAPMARPTRDIDFLGHTENSVANLEDVVRNICIAEVEEDGLRFDPWNVAGERIKEGAEYEGVRIRFNGLLEKARIPMQLDVAFGDVVHPAVVESWYPSLLGHPEARLLVYPRETVVAEKLQAMVFLGPINSRMKDFYDLWLLSRCFDFDGPTLAEAISGTFSNRGTRIDADPVALSSEFHDAPQPSRQWRAFLEKGLVQEAPGSLSEVAHHLRTFLLPPVGALVEGHLFRGVWMAPGPWR